MRIRLFILLFTVTLTAYAKTPLLEHVQLKWRATSEVKLGTVEFTQAPVQFEAFEDVRENKTAIGENREDDQPKPVTTNDDVGAFVGTHVRQLFDHAGFKTVDSDGAVTIKGEVTQFFVRETITYQSNVSVHVTATGHDGQVLWSGTASGEATRFGRSYRAENYFEVLSDATVNLVSSMLQSAEFQRALSAH
jgi:hypothetical protein